MPKIITKDTIIFLVVSNHNSFGVLIKLLPYILFEKYINILTSEMASPRNRHCANCIAHFRSLFGNRDAAQAIWLLADHRRYWMRVPKPMHPHCLPIKLESAMTGTQWRTDDLRPISTSDKSPRQRGIEPVPVPRRGWRGGGAQAPQIVVRLPEFSRTLDTL